MRNREIGWPGICIMIFRFQVIYIVWIILLLRMFNQRSSVVQQRQTRWD